MNKMILLVCVMLIFLAVPAFADTSVTTCQDINASDTYYRLVNNLTCSFTVHDLSNSVFDCQGYSVHDIPIAFDLTGPTNNFTIKNCYIYDISYFAISSESSPSDDIVIENNTINLLTYPADAIYLSGEYQTDWIIRNNTFINSCYQESSGIWLGFVDVYYNMTLYDNIFTVPDIYCRGLGLSVCDSSEDYSIYFGSLPSYRSVIYNNYFNDSALYGYSGGTATNINWNTTLQSDARIYGNGTEIGGNFYGSPYYCGGLPPRIGTISTCQDLNQDGFCDSPNDFVLNVGSLGTDYLPLSLNYSAPLPPPGPLPLRQQFPLIVVTPLVIGAALVLSLTRRFVTGEVNTSDIIWYFVLAVLVISLLGILAVIIG
jgi:hypothetical protein